MRRIRVPVLPHQKEFNLSQAKHPLLVGGYGSGKTQAFIQRSVDQHVKNPGFTGLMAEPTYPMIRDVLLPDLEDYLKKSGIRYKFRRAEMSMTTRYGKILLRSAENWRRWASMNLAWGGIDEIALLSSKDPWMMLLSRLRRGITLAAHATTTPEGFNFVYDLWADDPGKGYELIRADTRDNPFLPDEFIESLLQNYDERLILQYMRGEFVNINAGVIYHAFHEANNACDTNIKPDREILVGMDFNVDPMTCVLAQEQDAGNEVHICEEIVEKNSETEKLCKKLRDLYPQAQFMVYPDATGSSRRTVGRTDIAIIKKVLGDQLIRVTHPSKNPRVRDRFNSFNAMLCSADGKIRLKINKRKCPELVKDLRMITHPYDEYKKSKANKDRTHVSDGAGYLIHRRYPVGGKPQLKVHKNG